MLVAVNWAVAPPLVMAAPDLGAPVVGSVMVQLYWGVTVAVLVLLSMTIGEFTKTVWGEVAILAIKTGMILKRQRTRSCTSSCRSLSPFT